MKVQRLIEKYKKLEGVWDAEGAELARQIFLQDLEQLDKPEKVKVPQFVADWIRKCKTFKNFIASLSFALQPVVWAENSLSDECIDWLMNADNQETFARAWLDGYDIQETKYVVTDGNHLYFKKCQEDIEIVILVDEQPGTMEYVKKFDTKEEAQKAADILGWKVEEDK
nr:MAG TPA: Protein of unknown function (DUF1642) [Caudoviricetes sp.]